MQDSSPGPPTAPGAVAGAAPLIDEHLSLLDRLRNRDHTSGNLLVSIAVIAIPSIAMMLMGGAVFQLFDLRFLSLLGDDAVAAAGSTNQTLRQLFFMLSFGISVAAQMLIARLVGEARIERAEHVAGQTFVLAIALSAITALVGLLFAPALVSIIARDPAVVALGTIYLRIVCATLFVSILVQTFGAVLAGAGDSTTPMLVSFLTAPAAILMEWALAFGHLGLPPLGIAGIALGAACGGALGMGVALWALFSGRCRVHIRRRHLMPDPKMLRLIVASSWQPALHMLARTAMVFFFMWLAGRLGGKVQAAYTIGLRLEMVPILIAFPISNACATLVGQSLGARDVPRAWRSILVSFGVEISFLWPIAFFFFVFRESLVSAFTQDPEVVALASQYLAFSSAMLITSGLYFVSFRSLQAAGDMNSPMVISVAVALLVGAPGGYFLATQTDLGATGMWIANLAYAYINAVLMIGWLLMGRWTGRHLR